MDKEKKAAEKEKRSEQKKRREIVPRLKCTD
jgi:hypothetical protein